MLIVLQAQQFQATSNEIPIWNGYKISNVLVSNASGATEPYSINNADDDKLVISLGNITSVTGSGILFNRNFEIYPLVSGMNFTDVSGTNEFITTRIYARFKLVGSSQTYYFLLSNFVEQDWITSDIFLLYLDSLDMLTYNNQTKTKI